MKIVFVMPAATRLGGAEQMLWTILRHTRGAALNAVVVFLNPGPFEQDVASLGLPTVVLSASRLRHVRRFRKTVVALASILRSQAPDAVVSWLQKPHLYAAPAAALAGLSDRLVWWQHDIPRSRNWIDRAATTLPARAIGTSSLAAARAQGGLRPKRPTFVVQPGTDPLPEADPSTLSDLRNALGIADQAFVVGMAARLQPWKGQHHLVEAVARLRARGHDVCALIVGGDAYGLAPGYGESLQELVNQLDLNRAVAFTGQVPDVAPYLQLMDVLVNASSAEPFGIALLEAMSLGIPVIAANAGGPAEILNGGAGGLLVPKAGPDEIAKAVESLLENPSARRELAAAGRLRWANAFTAQRMVRDFERSLSELVADAPAPRAAFRPSIR